MSICGLIHVKPTDQTRCQKCWPAGPSGLCAIGVVALVGIAIVVCGSALLPGLPVRLFCSTGLGGLPTGLGIGWFEVVRFACLRVDWFVVCYLLPSCADDVAVLWVEFNDAGKSSELLRCYQRGTAAAERVEDEFLWSCVVDDQSRYEVDWFHRWVLAVPRWFVFAHHAGAVLDVG